jgi:hypothetical protein
MLKLIFRMLINELYKGEISHGKKLLKINALLLPNYKSHLGAKKMYKGNGLSKL